MIQKEEKIVMVGLDFVLYTFDDGITLLVRDTNPLNKITMKRDVNYKNVKYGMLVEILYDSGYHAGMKVHFFNHKGVLVGNIYEFLPYERLRLRKPYKDGRDRSYPRYFMNERFEKQKMWLFIKICSIVTYLIKFTQSKMHKYD